MKIAAIADIHVTVTNREASWTLLQKAADGADVLLICGDLTQEGNVEEAKILKELLIELNKPTVMVMGNHDYENDQASAIRHLLISSTIHVLDGEAVDIGGVGFAGVKGYLGGFGDKMLPKFGEPEAKIIVDQGINEALKLEKALSLLDTKTKIVLTHYSPIRDTVIGEPLEIFPFLGLTRLEGPINRFGVTMTFHGHAHHGTYEGKTSTGLPVYNVAVPILTKLNLPSSRFEIQP